MGFGRRFGDRGGRLARRRSVGRRPHAGRLLAFGLAGPGGRLLLLGRGRLRGRRFDRGHGRQCGGLLRLLRRRGLGFGFRRIGGLCRCGVGRRGLLLCLGRVRCLRQIGGQCRRGGFEVDRGDVGVFGRRSRTRVDRRGGRDRRCHRRRNVDGHGLRRDNTGFDVGFAAVVRRLFRRDRRLGFFRRFRVAFGHHDGGLGEDRELLGALHRHVGRDRGFARLLRDRVGRLAILGLPRAGGSRGLVGIHLDRLVGTLRVIARAPRPGPGAAVVGPTGFVALGAAWSLRTIGPLRAIGPLGTLPARRTRRLRGVEQGFERILWPRGGRLATGSRLTHGPQGDRVRHDFWQGSSLIRREDRPFGCKPRATRPVVGKSFEISYLVLLRGRRARGLPGIACSRAARTAGTA